MTDPAEHAPRLRPTARSLTFHPDFRRLWIADAASQTGVATSLFVLPLLAARVLHATPFQVGLVSMAMTVSFLVLGLPAGAWVDRMRRRSVLFACDVGRALVLAAIPLAAVLGLSGLALLVVVALVYGALTVFFDVAYQSYLPELVGWDRLVEGNAKLGATVSVAQMAGPVAGGWAAQALTVPYALIANTVCFAWSALWIWRIRARQPGPERRPDRHLGREIAEGLRFVLGHRLLGRMNATMRFLVWGTMPLGALLGGMLAGVVGVRAVVWIAAIGMALAFLPVFLSPLRTMRELPAGEWDGRALTRG